MRLKPPKTKKKKFNKEEFKEYALAHEVIGDGEPIPIEEFFKKILEDFRDNYKVKALMMFMQMWPYQYQLSVYEIFKEIADKDSRALTQATSEKGFPSLKTPLP